MDKIILYGEEEEEEEKMKAMIKSNYTYRIYEK